MSDNNIVLYIGFSVVSILLFLMFCNLYQPNAAIASLTLTTIFMSLIWVVILQWGILLLVLLIVVIAGALS